MKTAIVGVWHVHADQYTQAAKKFGEVVGVYDENSEWRKRFAEKHQIKEFATYDELFASDAEGVIVCAPTNCHTEIIIKAANAGKQIFTEKVLALSSADCEKIKEAIIKNDTNFVISFPWKFVPGIMALKEAADKELIGKINYMRFRNCHDGSLSDWLPPHFYDEKACGGGAMIDLGAHGMYLTHHFIGEPIGYSSCFSRFDTNCKKNKDNVEDNAVCVMSFENGAIAINETGFVSRCCPVILELGGDKGYVSFDSQNAYLSVLGQERVKLDLPKAPDSPIEAFVQGKKIEGCGIEEACVLTKMMENAYRSAQSI